uniref:Uncharacterized protein n=1 Tax=Quercus lobata TaxID=97700 RepID=A0A7N2MVA5_QUELO
MSGGCFSTIRCAVKGWYNYYIYFSTSALFISGLVLSHSFAEYAVVSTLIDYLTGNWEEQHLPKAVAIIKFQDGVATVLAVVLAYVADSCIGRVNMIVFTTISYVSCSSLHDCSPSSILGTCVASGGLKSRVTREAQP